MALYQWSGTAADNDDADATINWAEGQAASTANNSARAMMARIKEAFDAMGGAKTSSGSANAYVLSTGLSLSAYQNGYLLAFEANHTNTGASTIAIDTLATKSLKTPAGAALSSGMITAGGIYLIVYESGADVVQVLNAGADASTLQPLDATLTALAGWANGTNKIPYTTATDVVASLTFYDEDAMTSNSATGVPSQQSVKAYVDGVVGAAGALLTTNNLSELTATASTARTNIVAATTSQVEMWSFLFISPTATNYDVVINSPYAVTVNSITTQSTSGTATLTGKINTTALGGTANSISSSEQTQTHSSANSLAAGDNFRLTFASVSSVVNAAVTVKVTRTLA